MRYQELNQLLKGRNAQSKKWANNTYLNRRGENIALQYHNTDVATFRPDDSIILTSGGWHTSTTKERINMALQGRFYLRQELGRWFIGDYTFADGMIIKSNGSITGAGKDNPKADKKLKAKVKAFAQLCADNIPLDKPGAGDCFYCQMKTEDGQSLGDATKDTSHLDSHIQEGYIVPSLVFNALKESNCGDMIYSLVFNNPNKVMVDTAQSYVKKSVYRYILKRKGFAV